MQDLKQYVSMKKLVCRNMEQGYEYTLSEDLEQPEKLRLPFCLFKFKKRSKKQFITVDVNALKLAIQSEKPIHISSSTDFVTSMEDVGQFCSNEEIRYYLDHEKLYDRVLKGLVLNEGNI